MKEAFADLESLFFDAADRFTFGVEERVEGVVTALGDGVARVSGLSGVCLDERVTLQGGVDGLVLDLARDDVGVVLLGSESSVHVGSWVRGSGGPVSVPVGPSLLGRVLDPLGRPLDGKPAPAATTEWPVEREAPRIVDRASVEEQLVTGVTVIDSLFPIGRGQRQLVIGDLGTGKSTLAIDAVIAQRDTGVRCVYVVIGKKVSSVVTLVESLVRHGALAHTTVIAAPADAPAGLRFLAPYAACSMAEHFRDRGEDALIVFDDLSRHAIAYRELALLLRRPVGREAYPGDIFFVHSRLLERATHLSAARGGGSLTALPIAETQAGRISDFIPTNLISITDGQLYLDPQRFERGIKPAVDIGLSVSRVGGKTQGAALKQVAGPLRLDLARFHEVEVFARFGTRLEESTRHLLERGARAQELLKQAPASPVGIGEQVAVLRTLGAGGFDRVAPADVTTLSARYREALREAHADLLRAFARGRLPTGEEAALLDAALLDAALDDAAPGDAAPGEAALDDAAPGDAAPGEAALDAGAPKGTTPGDAGSAA